MSALDQPILIANSNYHVGHQVAIAVAEEQGYFREEGLASYDYDSRGLIPGSLEREGIALAIKDHGVDIATAVDVEAAVYQRILGNDLFIVGGWRYTPYLKWYGARGIADVAELRGKRIGVREGRDGLTQVFIANALRAAGVNPDTGVQWVYDPVFGYRNNPAHAEMLRLGKVDAVSSSPPFFDDLEKEGYPVILDPNKIFPRRPGKVTIATARMIEQRSGELRAFLGAIIRAFWFMRDVDHFVYLRDLESRLRKTNTHNDDERRLMIVSAPDRVDSWALPIDGGVDASALDRIAEEMVTKKKLERSVPATEVLRDAAVRQAYGDLTGRIEMRPALDKALRVVEKYGF